LQRVVTSSVFSLIIQKFLEFNLNEL